MNLIWTNILSSKKDIKRFIQEMHNILDSEDFSSDHNIMVISRSKSGDKEQFSTRYTLLDLEYDIDDIVNCLKDLKLEEYSETKIDRDNDTPPLLYVFGKYIQERLVYIKLKIKEDNDKYILCLSFHYAEREMNFPYR